MKHRQGYVLEVPRAPLEALYGETLNRWFAEQDVEVRFGLPVSGLRPIENALQVETRVGPEDFEFVVLATPWRRAAELLSGVPRCAELGDRLRQLQAAPITSVHLWFDREITALPHAVLVGRLSQWMFQRTSPLGRANGEYYYQVVISASRELDGSAREHVIEQVRRELGSIFDPANSAHLLRARVITEPEAVFSPVPGVDRYRPCAATPQAGLYLAGDWTATGWPSTMEGAVRSGYSAAERVLAAQGREQKLVVDELTPTALATWLTR